MSTQDDTRPLLYERLHLKRSYSLHLGLPFHAGERLGWARRQTQNFLTSKFGHYCILTIVALDVSCIFADFVITIINCEHKNDADKGLDAALEALGIVSLVFSCLFVLELFASVWAFGLRYFHSKFHVLDSLVIIASFVVDVLLRGVIEEVASLIIVLRLWRVFKIIEELSMGASEQMADLQEKIESLEVENDELRHRVRDLERGSD